MFPYVGGKSKIGKWIFEQMPENKEWGRYTEVFGGAMWVYINRPIKAKEYHYNDFNPFLYNLWRCMTEKRQEFVKSIVDMKSNVKPFYDECRKYINGLDIEKEKWIETIPNIEIAKRYIYLATNSFSGIIGGGMRLTVDQLTPFKKRIQDKRYTDKLDKISEVHNLDFSEIIDRLDCEDGFFYVDPPYLGKEHLYSFHNFNLEKHEKLTEILKSVKSHWILSYYNENYLKPFYPERDYVWLKKKFSRSSSPLKGKGKKGEEVLIFPKKFDDFRENLKISRDRERDKLLMSLFE